MEWHTERRSVSELRDHPQNPRQFTTKGVEDLRRSIEECGYVEPIAINTDGTILSGHARKKVLIECGITDVDVRVPERPLDDMEQRVVLLRMNKNIAGEFDFEILANEFDLDELKNVGFTDYDLKIADLIAQGEKIPEKDQESGYVGLPVYDTGFNNPTIVVNFETKAAMEEFGQRMGLDLRNTNRNTYSCWWPPRETMDIKSVKFQSEN